MKIIFEKVPGTLSVKTATPEYLSSFSSEWSEKDILIDVANKQVPSGVKYKIIEDTDLPSDRDFRNAWEWDFTTDFDGVGS